MSNAHIKYDIDIDNDHPLVQIVGDYSLIHGW